MRNHLKTLLLIFLSASALFLVWRAYGGSILFRDPAEVREFAPERLDYVRAAAAPVKFAIMLDTGLFGAQYDPAVALAYTAYRALFAEAIAGFSELSVGGGEIFDSLDQESVYFEFLAAKPLGLIAAWLSAPPLLEEFELLEIRGIGLFGEQLILASNTEIYVADIEVLLTPRPELSAALLENLEHADFAGLTEFAPFFHPLGLLVESVSKPYLRIDAPPDISAFAAFLENLGLSPADTPFYQRGDSRVYIDVDKGTSCRISHDGRIVFANPNAGLRPSRQTSIAEDVLLGFEAISLLHSAMGDVSFMLKRAEGDGNGDTLLKFIQKAGNVPIIWEGAIVRMINGEIREILLNLCRAFLVPDEGKPPLPVELAASLTTDIGANRLGIRYDESGGNVIWAITKG